MNLRYSIGLSAIKFKPKIIRHNEIELCTTNSQCKLLYKLFQIKYYYFSHKNQLKEFGPLKIAWLLNYVLYLVLTIIMKY